ncbi:unnamed protein product [Angiostrongylus costaricensis]|uniref:Protein kinase domain-containing protein n=1 Tax=Angiostrongylus costaricensis TaxID=334426 RepID=A0A158PDT6_ANGCS|nr:unnamed protein product [Angiostrongylus costaricensis]
MFLMLFLTVRAESCKLETNLSLAVCKDLASYHYADDTVHFLRTLRLENCSTSSDVVTSTAVETLDIQCTDSIPVFAFENFIHVNKIILSRCELSQIKWQSLYVNGIIPTVDLSGCSLDCSCMNRWLTSKQPQTAYSVLAVLPDTFHCSFLHCISGTLTTLPYIECIPGDSVTIDVNISAPTFDIFVNKRYFTWHMSHLEYNVTEHFTKDRIWLDIDVVTEEQLGTVVVVCWHCELPLMTTIESVNVVIPKKAGAYSSVFVLIRNFLIARVAQDTDRNARFRVRVPIRARLEDREDSHLIIIYGWPIVPINLTIERNDVAETQTLSDDNAVVFFDSLVVRPDNGKLLLCLMILNLQLILQRKKTIRSSIGSRRASRVTEETLLRLEERSLSSSDYSGQLIPFINMGSIQIHECIGKIRMPALTIFVVRAPTSNYDKEEVEAFYMDLEKFYREDHTFFKVIIGDFNAKGEFGEVYCGSWEKTGERSVAIKTIKADEDVEKEVADIFKAVVLSRLEHPNIVRLYGMARDGPHLLLVFERMNLGDLRTYLRARAPTSSSYSQFPPALVEDELRLIVRQIVSGLCYLTTQQIVHRDLAARNCLVNGESDLRCCLASQRPPIVVKISDFGMSRRLYGQNDYYRMQNHCLLPVRWLPPEAITDHKFSTSSDVWALGVTIWEVFSYGEVPFAELNNFEMVSYAMAGMRPPRPKSCPIAIYELMERCWALVPDDRIRPEEALLDPCLTPTLSEFIGVFPT